ncbi:MAG: stage II sporulation protein M [Planctomycetes bacterium]|nr:stage II sporulation protein M [Planctomycetota bacterium]
MPAHVTVLDSSASFATPEHIAFTFRLAGPMIRFWAWLIDVVLRVALMFVLAIPLLLLGLQVGIGIWLLMFFFVDWLLGGLIEWRWEGFTPGKKACGIRVIGVDGLPAGAGACFLRNVLRYADSFPTFATGLIAMVVSGRFQRLGDLAGGTLVVYAEGTGNARPVRLKDQKIDRVANDLPAEIQAVVDGTTLRAVVGYVARRGDLHPQRRAEMAKPLAQALIARLELPRTLDPDLLLCAIYQRLAAPVAERGGLQVASRAAGYLARRQRTWAETEDVLKLRTYGSATRSTNGDPPPARFAALYRAACADLALADAYHLPESTVGYLHHLVARAHLRFYRRLSLSWRHISQQVLVEVPGRLYGDGCLRTALLAFYGTFFLSALLGWANPEAAQAYLSEGMVDDLKEMYADPPNKRSVEQGGMMYGFYISNNVGITLACFASGIFAGIGSLLWLAANGVFLGFCFGYMATVDASTKLHFFEFVTAHGPFELTGIALGGAAGLRLGLGLVRTRGLPRMASLMRSARESVPIIAVAAVLVATAAPIEAFISPSGLPWAAKGVVSLICAALLVFYLVVLGRRAQAYMRVNADNGDA